MSGELRLSQFRWTTTANDDFVIGSPDEVAAKNPKFLVFQTNTTPGYASNPHFRCEWSGSAWEFKMNQGAGATDLVLTGMAYLDSGNSGTQTFSATNIFDGSVSLNSTTDVNGTFTANNLANFNSLFTITNTGNSYKATIGVSNSATQDVTLTLPLSPGVLVVTNDLNAYVTLGTSQNITAAKTLSSAGAILYTGGSINSSGNAIFSTIAVNGSAFTVSNSGVVAGTSFTGNHLGSLIGLTLPGSGTDGQTLLKSGTSLVWATPGSVAVNGMLLHDTVTADVYKLQITNGVLTTVLQ